jgi:hypothetical protein
MLSIARFDCGPSDSAIKQDEMGASNVMADLDQKASRIDVCMFDICY